MLGASLRGYAFIPFAPILSGLNAGAGEKRFLKGMLSDVGREHWSAMGGKEHLITKNLMGASQRHQNLDALCEHFMLHY